MSAPPFGLDRRALMRSFDRAGSHYDAAARLQRRVREELLQRLDYFALSPHWILDLGAGTCQAQTALQRRYRSAGVLNLDLAAGMLRAAPASGWLRRAPMRVCADAYALPLADSSVELVFSNLMLQWCDQPLAAFTEVARVLKPEGLFVFSTFGPETLRELRAAWQSADGAEHVSAFPDMPQLGEALMHSGLREPVLDIESTREFYPDAMTLMRELKQIGATHAAATRRRGLTARAPLQRAAMRYEQLREARGLPATYEIIFGAVFGGSHDAAASGRGGEHVVPLSAVRRRS